MTSIFNIINPPDRNGARDLFIKSNGEFSLPRSVNGNPNDECVIKLLAKDDVEVGGFFNSFFDFEFRKLTGLSDIYLNLEFQGKAILTVKRENPGSSPDIPVETLLDAPERKNFSFKIPLKDKYEEISSSRLSFNLLTSSQLDSGDYENVLFKASWGTPEAKKRPVSLAIVMCTFKNEELCLKNVDQILKSKTLEEEDMTLLIVDNGSSLEGRIPKSDRIEYIAQSNLGGAGGFTRGMLEVCHGSLKSKEFTHVLLMDDDISIEPEVLRRTKRYQEYTIEDTVIGGAMLNLKVQNHLHELGAFYSRAFPGSLTVDHHRGLADSLLLDSLGKGSNYDYTAWWFCSISTKAIREVGLPNPVFIRRDDTEYGERLRNSGRTILCASGIGVWHAPFEAKPITWMQYFDIRNDYITLSTTAQRSWSAEQHKNHIRKSVRFLLMHNYYGRAELFLLAIEHFLDGPSILDKDAGETFKLVRESFDKHSAPFPPNLTHTAKKFKPTKLKNFLRSKTYNFHTGIQKKASATFITDDPASDWREIPGNCNLAVVSEIWGYKIYFPKKLSTGKELLQRMNTLLARMDTDFESVSNTWSSNIANYQTAEFWKKYVNS